MTASAHSRLPALDFLRFFAAICVLGFHYTFRGGFHQTYVQVAYPELDGLFRYGYLGVDLFFIISGFVILLTVDAGQGLPSRFLASRISRLYPVFWVAVSVTFLIVLNFPAPFAVGVRDYLLSLTMLPTWFNASPVDGVYWTLAVELQFYFFVAAYLLLLRHLLSLDAALALWLISIVALLALPDEFPRLRRIVLADWGALFVAGAVLYRIWRYGWSGLRGILLGVAWAGAMLMAYREALRNSMGFETAISPWLAMGLDTLALAAVALLCFRPNWMAGYAGTTAVLGALTYPLYLIHQKLGYLVIGVVAPELGRWVALVAATACMLALAWLLHRLIEVPYNGLLRRWLESRLRVVDSAVRIDIPIRWRTLRQWRMADPIAKRNA